MQGWNNYLVEFKTFLLYTLFILRKESQLLLQGIEETYVVTYFCCGTETVNVNESELLAYLYTVYHFRDILLNRNTDMIPKY